MTDYWKSTPRKFCDFCKCWLTDNKPSIEFHEKGKRHQDNVKKRILEVRKKGEERHQAKLEEQSDLAEMEAAALAAVQKDLASGDPNLASAYGVQMSTDKPLMSSQPVEDEASKTAEVESEWVEARTEQGYTYYWNKRTKETTWNPPAEYVPIKNQQAEETKKKEKVEKKESPSGKKRKQETDSQDTIATVENSKVRQTPYGEWEPAQQTEEPAVDLELPVVQANEIPLPAFPEEKKSKLFKEKTVTSLAKPSENVPRIVFKKRKVTSGAQNLRQKGDS